MSLHGKTTSLPTKFYQNEILHELSIKVSEVAAQYARLNLDEIGRRHAIGDWMRAAREIRMAWEVRNG